MNTLLLIEIASNLSSQNTMPNIVYFNFEKSEKIPIVYQNLHFCEFAGVVIRLIKR